MKFTLAALLPLALALSASASGLSCKKNLKRNFLIGYNPDNKVERYEYGYNENWKFDGFLEIKNSTIHQQFEFYDCEAPSDDFHSSHGNVHYGQVRPTDEKDLCLSSEAVFVYKGKDKKESKIRVEPEGIVNNLLLKPCASEGEDLRHQWFKAREVEDCGVRLSLKGKKGDVEADGLVHNSHWTVSLEPFSSWDWREAFYLSEGQLDPKCALKNLK
ncbi:hypothetical protein MCAP1_001114 [Malassezia caprae]|uniref:Uncharacterized protein n=1 Tax=Malassezia caprae TaxID=1381934 RepID=A0AAF0E8Z4_9BASI|nr:hypothetical protein MCAP1_001114 [Malassezia caprae]